MTDLALPGCAAAALIFSGTFALYMASPHQRLMPHALPRRSLARGGMIALLLALVLLLAIAGPATAVFILMTLAMLLWSVLPLAIAWWHHRQEAAQ